MKRAISPLMSTVVLLGFAALLGLLVMSWGFSTEATTCDDVAIALTDVSSCVPSDAEQVLLESNGASAVERVRVVALTADRVGEQDADLSLAAGSYAWLGLSLPPEAINIRIIPMQGRRSCVERRIDVPVCP